MARLTSLNVNPSKRAKKGQSAALQVINAPISAEDQELSMHANQMKENSMAIGADNNAAATASMEDAIRQQ